MAQDENNGKSKELEYLKQRLDGLSHRLDELEKAIDDVLWFHRVGDIALAYVVNLVNGDEVWAEKGKGAFLNGKKIKTQKDDVFYLIAYEAQAPRKDFSRILTLLSESRKTRCLGSTALDLAYLASGGISVFVSPSPSRGFDFAGGWLLVKEAGGIFTDLGGKNIDTLEVSLKKSTTLLVAGNNKLHEKALRLLS